MREGRVSMLTTGSGRLIRKKMMRRAQKGRKEGKISGKWKGDLPIDCWLRFSQSFLFPFFSFFLFPLFFFFPPRPHFSAMDERGCASSRLPDWVLAASPLHLLF